MNLYFGLTGLLERLPTYVVTADAAVACGGIQEGHATLKLKKLKHCTGEKSLSREELVCSYVYVRNYEIRETAKLAYIFGFY